MKPENNLPAGNTPTNTPNPTNQDAAANVIRSQISSLYGDSPVASAQPIVQPASQAAVNPYDRTHQAHPQPEAEQWKQYHTAWQTYYQKYYEGYYAAQSQPVQQQPTQAIGSKITDEGFFTEPVASAEELNKDQALYELRQKLLGKVEQSAKKIRRSKHFIPVVAALAVILIFVFLQYNRVFIATVSAYVSPGAISEQNIVIDPTADGTVSADPRLIIPKINVDVPVLYDVGTDYDSQMAAMAKGVADFAIPGASSRPGQVGNTVLSGHSSNDLFDGGDYKFIFAQLEKMNVGDTVYTNYESKRYTYVVTKTEIVKPTDVAALVYPTDKPILTLITCTPLGTSRNRLLVTAEQVSPDPAASAAAPADSGTASGDTVIPGSSPTLIEKLFGAN